MIFSIIIPHKNSAILLLRLLKSIPSNNDYQIIVIDDNSNNETITEIKKIQKNINFELYKNEGNGAGGARNTGLKYANGKWLIFADADDFFLPSFAKLTKEHKNDDEEIIYFNVTSCYSDTLKKANRDEHINKLFSLYLKTHNKDILRCRYTPPWGKMIKKELVTREQIKFEECSAGNDNWFSVNTGLKAKNIKVINEYIYCVTSSSESITAYQTQEKFEARFHSTLRTNALLRKEHKEKYQLSVLYYLFQAYKWGIKYELKIISECIKNKANPFIGLDKILQVNKILSSKGKYYEKEKN